MTTTLARHGGAPASAGRTALALTSEALASAVWGLASALGDRREGAGEGPSAAPPSRPVTPSAGLVGAAALDVLTPVLRRIDVNALLERLDVQRLVDRIDVDALIERIDVDRVLASVDPNRVLERVDVDALVRRVDLAAAAREAQEGIDVGGAVDEAAREAAPAGGLGRIVARLLRRPRG